MFRHIFPSHSFPCLALSICGFSNSEEIHRQAVLLPWRILLLLVNLFVSLLLLLLLFSASDPPIVLVPGSKYNSSLSQAALLTKHCNTHDVYRPSLVGSFPFLTNCNLLPCVSVTLYFTLNSRRFLVSPLSDI